MRRHAAPTRWPAPEPGALLVSASRSTACTSGSSSPRRGGPCANARSASSSSAARRSRPGTTGDRPRPRACFATDGCAPATSRIWWTESSSFAVASRTSSSLAAATSSPRMSSAPSPRSRACGRATSSPSGSRDGAVVRPSSWWPRPRPTSSVRCATRCRAVCARPSGFRCATSSS